MSAALHFRFGFWRRAGAMLRRTAQAARTTVAPTHSAQINARAVP